MIWSENFGEIGYHFENRDSQGEKRGVAPLYPYPARRRQQNPIFHARNNWNSSEETTGFVIGARAILSFSPLLLLPVLLCLSLSPSFPGAGEERRGTGGKVRVVRRVTCTCCARGARWESWLEVGRRGPTERASHARLGHEPRPTDLLTISIVPLVLYPRPLPLPPSA